MDVDRFNYTLDFVIRAIARIEPGRMEPLLHNLQLLFCRLEEFFSQYSLQTTPPAAPSATYSALPTSTEFSMEQEPGTRKRRRTSLGHDDHRPWNRQRTHNVSSHFPPSQWVDPLVNLRPNHHDDGTFRDVDVVLPDVVIGCVPSGPSPPSGSLT